MRSQMKTSKVPIKCTEIKPFVDRVEVIEWLINDAHNGRTRLEIKHTNQNGNAWDSRQKYAVKHLL